MPVRKIVLYLLLAPLLIIALGIIFLILKRPPEPIQIEPLVLADSPYQVKAADIAIETKFQGTFDGNLWRGRALLAADYDLDGRVDIFVGNPGDPSFVLRNVEKPGGGYEFEYVQTLLEGNLSWGGATSDFDNDGDYDIFITNGANEGIGYDYLFRNDYIETGKLHFTDVTKQAGVSGPVSPSSGQPMRTASGNARLADYDQDGDVDIFVSTNYLGIKGKLLRILRHGAGDYTFSEVFSAELPGRNTLWRNDGNLKFTDVTAEVGLEHFKTVTRHSSWLDYDNDGDQDLYENNMGGKNALWKNLLVETGEARFIDVTSEFTNKNDNIAYPVFSFVSAVADINNDGWEDLVVFYHHKPGGAKKEDGPYEPGHMIYINQSGDGYKNIAEQTGINIGLPLRAGVMGCQVGDISGDGVPDIFFGNGDPFKGTTSQLYISELAGEKLKYINATNIIDYPADQQPGIKYPPYPYRTHGTTFIDLDNDGDLEIASLEGGPALEPDVVREPNRLYELDIADSDYIKVKLKGDGEDVSLDAIGTRLALKLEDSEGNSRTIYRTLYGSSCFSAHNSFTVHFYIGKDVAVSSLSLVWPNGKHQAYEQEIQPNSTIAVSYDGS